MSNAKEKPPTLSPDQQITMDREELIEEKTALLDAKTPPYAWVILLITFLVSFAAPMAQFKLVSIPTYFIYIPHVSPDGCFGLDGAGFGMLMTLVSLIGIVLAFPGAFICRKMGLRNTVMIATLGVILGGLIQIAGGDNVATLMAGRIFEGTGIGLVGVAAPTVITLWFPEKTRGFALGLWCCWVPLSITLDSMLCPVIAASFGWRGVFAAVVIFAAVALALFMLLYRMPHSAHLDYSAEGSFAECVQLLKNPQIWLLGFVFLIFIIGQTGIVNTYLPTFLQSTKPVGYGWTEATAGMGLALVTGISIVANPVGGAFTSKLPLHYKRITPALTAVLSIAAFAMIFQTESESVCWAGLVLMGICGGIGGGGLRPLAPITMKQSAMAATMGMAVMQFMQCIGNCFSPIYGSLIDGGASYWQGCLYTIIPLCVIMLICGLLINPKKSREF